MLRNDVFSAGFVTIYLILYCLMLQFDNTKNYGMMMLLFSPFLICWMVYTVLKHGKYSGRQLGDEEFGYQDKPKDELRVLN
ncbi:MAG: hypothetical protein V4557_14480 [Bacteroidota bacterium]